MQKLNKTLGTTILTISLSSQAFGMDFTFQNKINQNEAEEKCMNVFPNLPQSETLCDQSLENLFLRLNETEGGFYEYLFEVINFSEELRDGSGYFNPEKKPKHVLPDRTTLSMDALEGLTIEYTVLGLQFGIDSSAMRGHDYLMVDKVTRYTLKQRGDVLVDTVLQFSEPIAAKLNCEITAKPKKCRKGKYSSKGSYGDNKHLGFQENIWEPLTSYSDYLDPSPEYSYYDGAKIRESHVSKALHPQTRYSELLEHEYSIFAGGFHWPHWYNRKAFPHNSDYRQALLITYVHDNRPHQATSLNQEFKRIEGGKAKFALKKINIFHKDAEPAYLTDQRYAGDVQLCINKVRSSIRQENSTNSLLSGIASMAGVGEVATALDVIDTVGTTWDNLSNREQNEVNACMSDKGH